jgi:hypothetical protein
LLKEGRKERREGGRQGGRKGEKMHPSLSHQNRLDYKADKWKVKRKQLRGGKRESII